MNQYSWGGGTLDLGLSFSGNPTYGTPPFDTNNEPGNATGTTNIVRTFDDVAYNLNLNLNSSTPLNVKIRLTGRIDGAVGYNNANSTRYDRIHAKFSNFNWEALDDGYVEYDREITTTITTNSTISVPITVNVLAAQHGRVLTPNFKLQIIEIDGVDVTSDNFITEISTPEPIIASAVVEYNLMLSNSNNAFNSVNFENHIERYITLVLAIPLGNTPKGVKGKTAPSNPIIFDLIFTEMLQPLNGTTQSIDILNRDGLTPFSIVEIFPEWALDYSNPNAFEEYTGSGKSYNRSHSATKVWDSGELVVINDATNQFNKVYSIEVSNYVIGATFPKARIDGWWDWNVSRDNHALGYYTIRFFEPLYYSIGGLLNPDYTEQNYRIHIEAVNPETRGAIQYTREYIQLRNNLSFRAMMITPNMTGHGNSDTTMDRGYQSTVYRSNTSINMGVILRRGVYLLGGFDLIITWNPESLYLSKANFQQLLITMTDSRTSRLQEVRDNSVLYLGVRKIPNYTIDNFNNMEHSTFDFYSDYDEAIQHGQISAIKIEVNTLIDNQGDSIGFILERADLLRLENISDKLGVLNKFGNPNIIRCIAYFYRDAARTNFVKERETPQLRLNHFSEYDDYGKLITVRTPPSNTGSSIYAVHGGLLNQYVFTVNKTNFNIDEIATWNVRCHILLSEFVILNDSNNKVNYQITFPIGINYVWNSGRIPGGTINPSITYGSDSTTLTFSVEIPSNLVQAVELPDVTFETNFTQVNNNASNSYMIPATYSSVLDGRPWDNNSSITAVNYRPLNITVNNITQTANLFTTNKAQIYRNDTYSIQLKILYIDSLITGLFDFNLKNSTKPFSEFALIESIEVETDLDYQLYYKTMNNTNVNISNPHDRIINFSNIGFDILGNISDNSYLTMTIHFTTISAPLDEEILHNIKILNSNQLVLSELNINPITVIRPNATILSEKLITGNKLAEIYNEVFRRIDFNKSDKTHTHPELTKTLASEEDVLKIIEDTL